MTASLRLPPHEEEFLARLTDIAYQTALRQGLQQPFVEVELDLWRRIRTAYLEHRAVAESAA